jgi:spore coat polysaccharide biosynthesis protein SpsF
MNSTRVPGKTLKEVMGRPLLSYGIERLRFSTSIDPVIVATTSNRKDDPIVEIARRENVICYRGSEDDVLDRFYKAAQQYNLRHVMRLTGDCPFIQADICDHLVNIYFSGGFDYVRTGETYAEGLDCEVMSFKALSRAWEEARLKSDREHVSLYIRNHPDRFRIKIVENDSDDSRYRITVDEYEDFSVAKAIFEHLYTGPDTYFTIADIKSLLDGHPEIYELNAHIIRNEGLLKSLEEER